MEENAVVPSAMPSVGGEGAKKNVLMAILAYIGVLIVVSYLVAKDDPFVKFHIKQALVLFIAEVAVLFLWKFTWMLWMLYSLVNLAILVLAIIGVVNAAQGKEEKLPLVGDLADQFRF